MQPDLMRADYDSLPESIKAGLSYLEYQWLAGAERACIEQTETEPERFD